MLEIGLIGLGPEWDEHYRPALAALRQRLHVKAVYDVVASRAALVAASLGAVHCTGMRALLDRADVAAVLILDPGWCGIWPMKFAIEHGKPAFVARGWENQLTGLEALSADAQTAEVLIVPELRLRATPATMRLRELTATRLGPVESLRVELDADASAPVPSRCIAAIDWCAFVVQSAPLDVTLTAEPSALRLTVHFHRATSRGTPLQAEVRLQKSRVGPIERPGPAAHVECVSGAAEVLEPHVLQWRSGGDEVRESLNTERPSPEVLLGHFARRIVGGLVPVPDLADITRVMRLLPRFPAVGPGD